MLVNQTIFVTRALKKVNYPKRIFKGATTNLSNIDSPKFFFLQSRNKNGKKSSGSEGAKVTGVM